MTALEHQLSDIQRELGSLAELLRAGHKRSSFSNIGYEDQSFNDSIRRRKPQPLVDVGWSTHMYL